MTETTDNLVLEHLRAIRLDIADLKGSNRDIRARLVSIENYIAALHGDSVRSGGRIEELQQRIERIESRLNLADA